MYQWHQLTPRWVNPQAVRKILVPDERRYRYLECLCETPNKFTRNGSASRLERVVTLVHWVKGIREIGCVTFLGEDDVKIARHWLRKIERVMTQMLGLEES
jgi:hypothetical protein